MLTNPALSFDRKLSYGKRLDIPAGSAVRFEPGETKTVILVEIGGKKCITGGNNLASGIVDISKANEIESNSLNMTQPYPNLPNRARRARASGKITNTNGLCRYPLRLYGH